MSKPLTLVVTAAGKTGSEVAALLLAQERPVHALVRADLRSAPLLVSSTERP